jgi:hypothetical protein
MMYLLTTDDFSLVKWFHDQAIPQVIDLDADPYTSEL